ncbi:MAG: hypothetical protein JO053_02760 [Acidobacteria bacterium]|nr:hypothetical protein [Acidobacteriota bacterium]
MKWLWRILFVVFAILLAINLPFVYRRYELRKLTEKVAGLEANHVDHTPLGWTEYKGIIHAHTSLGGHSTGTIDELIKGANDAGLDFVLMTEHYDEVFDTSVLTPNGVFGKTLFIGGNEIDTASGDRLLMIPGADYARDLKHVSTPEVIAKLHSENRLALITYPEKFNTWDAKVDGIEVLSLHTQAQKMNKFTGPLDLLWSGRAYPLVTIAEFLRRPDENLARYDTMSQLRRTVLFAGTDAHSNLGIHFFGDDAGHKYIDIKLDPYRVTFSITQMHVLLPSGQPLDREALLAAVKAGHFYTGIEAIGSTSGFSFSVTGQPGVTMGDEVHFAEGLMLQAAAPQAARIVVLKNGERFAEASSSEIAIKPDTPGVYRVEIYRTELGEPFDSQPWIMSNPIYIR